MNGNYLIYSRLKKYSGCAKGFHVPGHKARGEFKKLFPDAKLDITELSYSDDLHCPSEVIAEAQRDIAEILGAERSYILTDGSTSGIMAMLYALSRRGNKLIVMRNSHCSVWNACGLLGIEPIVVQGETRNGVTLPPSAEKIESLLEKDGGIVGVIATSPDYYGNISPLSEYSRVVKKYGKLLAVDEAHGAHLAFAGENRGYAGGYADIWVDGAHKTLPTLTQGAVLSVNNVELISDAEEGLGIFRTTSPSYPVMASVEYGVKYLKNHAEVYRAAELAAEKFRKEAGIPLYPSDDWTKLAADFAPLGISSDKAAAYLEKHGIYAELSDGRYLVFYLSPLTEEGELKRLLKRLSKAAGNKKLRGTYAPRPEIPAGRCTYSYLYALKKPCEYVPLKAAIGRMSARNVGISPPCIPVIVAGDTINKEQVEILERSENVFGLAGGKIRVVSTSEQARFSRG